MRPSARDVQWMRELTAVSYGGVAHPILRAFIRTILDGGTPRDAMRAARKAQKRKLEDLEERRR